MPRQELAQGGAVAAAGDVGVQTIGDDGNQCVGGGWPVGAVEANSDGQRVYGTRARYRVKN